MTNRENIEYLFKEEGMRSKEFLNNLFHENFQLEWDSSSGNSISDKSFIINLSDENFTIHNGDRLAQAVLQRVERMHLVSVEVLDGNTNRGTGGYGSTGIK